MRTLAKCLLWLGGWTAVGDTPPVKKAVVIAAPHTSNWDAVWALIFRVAVGLDIHFFGKHTLFWFPLGNLLRALGGVPLDRGDAGTAVAKVVDDFANSETYYFGLAPEGTRRHRPHWKSGFYRIAEAADVPVILGFMDFGRKRVGLGPVIELCGDREQDLARIGEFYADIEGCRPENAGPVIFATDD